MAIVGVSLVAVTGNNTGEGWQVTWGPMANGDTGDPVKLLAGHADKSIQVEGTFGAGGSVAAEGSNDLVNYRPLTDPQGNTIALAAGGIKSITEATIMFRPHVTGGDGSTALVVTVFFRRTPT